MSYHADKLRVDAHARTHTQTDAGNDNTRRPKLASGKNVSMTIQISFQANRKAFGCAAYSIFPMFYKISH